MKNSKLVSVIIAALAVAPAFGATPASPAATSVAKKTSALDNITLSTFHEAHFTNFETLGETGGAGNNNEMFVFNSIGLGYKLSPTSKITFSQRFNLILNKTSSVNGTLYQQLDNRVGLGFSKVIESGNYSMGSVGVQFELPFSASSTDAGKAFAIRAPIEQSYSVGRWTGTLTLIPRMHLYALSGNGKGADIDLYVGPSIAFQVSPKFSIENLFETSFGYTRAARDPKSGAHMTTMDYKVVDNYTYFRWQALEKLQVSPFIWTNPNDISAKTTTVGLELSGSIL